MEPVQPSPRKDEDPFSKQEKLLINSSNSASTGSAQQSESYGGEFSSSIIPSWPLGRPRSRLSEEGRISSQDKTLRTSGQRRSDCLGLGRIVGRKEVLGPSPSQHSKEDLKPPLLPSKKRVLESPQLYGHSGDDPHNSWMQPSKIPRIQPMRSSTPPPSNHANTWSTSHVMTVKSAQSPLEDSAVDVGMKSSPPNTGSRFQSETMLAILLEDSDDDNDVRLRPDNNSREPMKNPHNQPQRSPAQASRPSLPNTGLRSHVKNTIPSKPSLKGSHVVVSIKPKDNTTQPAKMPDLRPKKSTGSSSLSDPNTGLRSHSIVATSADYPTKDANVDVSMRQAGGQNDLLKTLQSDWSSARKRWHGKNPSANAEEVGNVAGKKSHLGWGQGLVNYEEEKRVKDTVLEMVACAAISASGDLTGSNTSMAEKTVSPAAVHASPRRCSALSVLGVSGDLDNNSSRMTEKVDFSAASGCSPPQAVGVGDDLGNRSTAMIQMIASQEALRSDHRFSGNNYDTGTSSTSKMTEVMLCSNVVPSFSSGLSPVQGVNNDPASVSMTGTRVCPATVPASSDGCNLPPDGGFITLTTVDVADKPISRGSDRVASDSGCPQGIVLPAQMTDQAIEKDFSFTCPKSKVEEPYLKNLNVNRSSLEEIKKDEQELTSQTNDICSSMDSTNRDESQGTTKAGCGDGESYHVTGLSGKDAELSGKDDESRKNRTEKCAVDGEQNRSGKENPELYAVSNESNDGKMQSNKENPKSDNKCGIVNNGAELSGNGLVQRQKDTEAMEIDTNNNNDNIESDKENPQHCVAPREISSAVSSCMETVKNHAILSPEGNDINEPLEKISNKAPEIGQLLSSCSSSALRSVNVTLDLDKIHVYSASDAASMAVNVPRRTTQIDLNIPDPASMDDASADRVRANVNLYAKVEMGDDLTHVQKYLQPETKISDIIKDPTNLPGCFKLFGKVIFQAPSSEIEKTSKQENQIHDYSSGMASRTNGEGASTSNTRKGKEKRQDEHN